jgi:hypothetical protein
MITYAVDFETYYDEECNIKTQGLLNYLNHNKFDAYLVSIVSNTGFIFIGNPRDFDWYQLQGQRLVSHNARFDEGVYTKGVYYNWWPYVEFAEWRCSSRLCLEMGLPRSLKNAVSKLYGMKISKQVRENMLGRTWNSLSNDEKVSVENYAYDDARLCLRLWLDLNNLKQIEYETPVQPRANLETRLA